MCWGWIVCNCSSGCIMNTAALSHSSVECRVYVDVNELHYNPVVGKGSLIAWHPVQADALCLLIISTRSVLSHSAATPVLRRAHSLTAKAAAQEHAPTAPIWPIRLHLHSHSCVSMGTGWLKANSHGTISFLSPDALYWYHSRQCGAEVPRPQKRDRQWVGLSRSKMSSSVF